jgi:hypothetical protein
MQLILLLLLEVRWQQLNLPQLRKMKERATNSDLNGL